MEKEVNVKRSNLFDDGMLHIEFLDGNSYLYSLQEIADIIAAQQSVQADGACACLDPKLRWKESSGWYCSVCYKPPRR